jgi:hypothetical protein
VSDPIQEATERVDRHMQLYYRVRLSDLEISDVPGYWRDREAKMHTGHPLHSCLFCDGPFRATYSYHDPSIVKGRFASPHKTWWTIKNAE